MAELSEDLLLEVPDGYRGFILLIGDDPWSNETARMLGQLAETQVVGAADAGLVLANADPDLVVVGGSHYAASLTEAGTLCPRAARIVVGDRDAETPCLPNGVTAVLRSAGQGALAAMCSLALRYVAAERAVRDLETENDRLRGIDAEGTTLALDELQGIERYEALMTRSPAMKRMFALLEKIEGNETTVLVRGETGTGKELVAQAIHARSRRRKGRFVAANLGAISDQLRESELFGHVRGAFTGATESRGGLFAEADGGSVFLDEVADASPGLQVALLRVIEEGTILPVGADRPRRVDVRIISGTNRDLEAMVRHGLFRRDLYYRLNVFPIELPSLRERPEDIFPLASHFLARGALEMGKKQLGISREARTALEAYPWEGNVRELRNVMERAAILCKGGLVIAADLPVGQRKNGDGGDPRVAAANIAIPPGGATLQQLEREIFAKTLAITRGNKRRAAHVLGLRESTFRFRMRKLGMANAMLEALASSPSES